MKHALIVVDMQNDFIDMALGSKEAAKIVPDVIQLIEDPSYDAVFATMDTHDEAYLSSFEGTHLPVAHCIKGTEGWKLNPLVEQALRSRNAVIIEKPTFGSITLAERMKQAKPEQITLCGLCTDICVLSNALLLRAYLPDVEINVIRKACAATTEQKQKETLDVMASCQIAVKED
ncbi:MAG: cysteine hydrolase [Solobacterium sp.]|jgi:nicotinamidase-related amidase|nr:cysteine hydrolase [Solobacterium sp.]MCH4223094.1 cysteine hydrolase [Solobacterium sp.]MCH4265079.1 cysteine hydrolase [Solobacterium sp.]